MSEAVWVCGLGAISAIGNTVEQALGSLETGASGIGPMQILQSEHHLTFPVAEVKLANRDLALLANLPESFPRTALLSSIAAQEALMSVGNWRVGGVKCGFVSATTVGGMDKTEHFFESFLNDPHKGRLNEVVHHECGSITEIVATQLGLTSFFTTINTACSSSANAIMLAARLIRQGHLDFALAGGADALTRFTLNGFNALMILDKAPCRPFDQSRAGLNLGEGAAYIALASERAIEQLGATPLCRLSGWHNATDAYHQTASSPEGDGSWMAMNGALQKAGLQPDEISYINVHGTGTVNNDQSESVALRRIFGEQCPPFSSTKAYTGHTLAASGSLEAVFSVLSLQQGLLFPNLRFSTPIEGQNLIPETSFKRGMTINHVVSNSFGFGGNCSTLIFSKN